MSHPPPHDPRTGHPHWQAQPGYPQPGYPQPGYPQQGFPQPGYPQPGYPQPGHAQQQHGHWPQAHPQSRGYQAYDPRYLGAAGSRRPRTGLGVLGSILVALAVLLTLTAASTGFRAWSSVRVAEEWARTAGTTMGPPYDKIAKASAEARLKEAKAAQVVMVKLAFAQFGGAALLLVAANVVRWRRERSG